MALRVQMKSKSPAAARMSALAIPMPSASADDEAAEGEDESKETCRVGITQSAAESLLSDGEITAIADDGETVVISIKQESESPAEDANESGEEE